MINKNKHVKNLKCHNKHRGFTLIELLVSFAILTTGVSAAMGLIAQSLKSSTYIKNELIASYLTVEGIELIRNHRDSNSLKGSNWMSGLNNCAADSDGCMVNPIDGKISSCGGKCDPLNYETDINSALYGMFNHEGKTSTNAATIFTRKITISKAVDFPNQDEREIVSEVKWNDRYGAHEFTLRNHIFDWIENN